MKIQRILVSPSKAIAPHYRYGLAPKLSRAANAPNISFKVPLKRNFPVLWWTLRYIWYKTMKIYHHFSTTQGTKLGEGVCKRPLVLAILNLTVWLTPALILTKVSVIQRIRDHSMTVSVIAAKIEYFTNTTLLDDVVGHKSSMCLLSWISYHGNQDRAYQSDTN